MHPSDTPNAKKLGFDPPNGGRREILPLIFKNLKIPLGCFPVLVCGPDWAQPTWRWALVMIGPWGHPWGVTKGVKRPKMRVLEETHENEIMKRNEKLKSFSSWPFLCLYVLCDKAHAFCLREPQSRRAVFSSYSTREFCREMPLFPRPLPTRLKCSQTFPLISSCVLSRLSSRLSTILLRLRYGPFLITVYLIWR